MDKDELIAKLKRMGYLKTPAVVSAFQRVPRADFVPEEFKDRAYEDEPLPIGEEQTISQPLTVAFMLELLVPKAGQTILDVGAGSGWQAALLADIVGQAAKKKGKVFTIERIPLLVKMARKNLASYIKKGVVEILEGDGSAGDKKHAPFDGIIAAATAGVLPPAWKEQIKPGGVIVAPVGQSIVKLTKRKDGTFIREDHPGFSFVPLISEEK